MGDLAEFVGYWIDISAKEGTGADECEEGVGGVEAVG
jgi:hypothetical protein